MRNRSATYVDQAAFRAISDPTRRALLDLLRTGSRPAGEIAGAFSISRPAISKHLRLLLRARLVREHREGRHRFYRINPAPLQVVDSWLQEYQRFWKANLESLKSFVEADAKAEKAKEAATSRRSIPKRTIPK